MTKKPNPKKRTAKKKAPKKLAKRKAASKPVRKKTAPKKRRAASKTKTAKRNPRRRPSLIRALIPIEDMQALAKGAAGDIEALANPRKRVSIRRVRKGKKGTGTRRNPFHHPIHRRAR